MIPIISYTEEGMKMAVSSFFDLTLPTTQDELKKQFRISVKKLHKATGSDTDNLFKELFISMKSVYDWLTENNPTWAFTNGKDILKTDEGYPLSEFGLGLGPNKNGRDCEHCSGKGFTEYQTEGSRRCTACFFGMVDVGPCQLCRQTGKFGVKGKGLVTCPRCKGTKTQKLPYPIVCIQCHGLMRILVKEKISYHGCYHCKGTGEIEIFNPVIPKGRLV